MLIFRIIVTKIRNNLPSTQYSNSFSLIFQLALINIRIRYKSTYLGLLWAAIEPLLYFIVLYIVFTSIRSRSDDFAIYLITGIMFFHIFSRGTIGGLISLTTNSSILQSIKVNKEIFPIVATTAAGILAFVSVGVFLGLFPVFQFMPSWTIVLLPIPLLLAIFLILGLSYFLSVVNVFVRDIQNLWQVFVHFFLFFSPIFWTIEEASGILLNIHAINPLGQLIELSHKLVTGNQIPPLNDWLYATSLVAVVFFIGYITFHKLENKITEKI